MVRFVSASFDHLEVRMGNMSGLFIVALRVLFIFAIFMWLIHVIACGWAFIGSGVKHLDAKRPWENILSILPGTCL